MLRYFQPRALSSSPGCAALPERGAEPHARRTSFLGPPIDPSDVVSGRRQVSGRLGRLLPVARRDEAPGRHRAEQVLGRISTGAQGGRWLRFVEAEGDQT